MQVESHWQLEIQNEALVRFREGAWRNMGHLVMVEAMRQELFEVYSKKSTWSAMSL